MASQPIQPPSPQGGAARQPTRPAASPTGRAAEAGRERALKKDKSNFQDLQERAAKRMVSGPFRIRPPVKISTRTIDTDTIGRINRANQRMSQFLYNLANEPSVGLFHVNDHVRRTVPRLVTLRKDMSFQKIELDKSSCDVDEILPMVRIIGNLGAFKSINEKLKISIQLAAARTTSGRSLGPPTPTRTPASTSPNTSMKKIDTTSVAPPESPSSAHGPSEGNPSFASEPSNISHESSKSMTQETTLSDTATPITTEGSTTPAERPSEKGNDDLNAPNNASKDVPEDAVLKGTPSQLQGDFNAAVREEIPQAEESSNKIADSLPSGPSISNISLDTEQPPSFSEAKLSQEEMILGARAHSMKKKKSSQSSADPDRITPKHF